MKCWSFLKLPWMLWIMYGLSSLGLMFLWFHVSSSVIHNKSQHFRGSARAARRFSPNTHLLQPWPFFHLLNPNPQGLVSVWTPEHAAFLLLSHVWSERESVCKGSSYGPMVARPMSRVMAVREKRWCCGLHGCVLLPSVSNREVYKIWHLKTYLYR